MVTGGRRFTVSGVGDLPATHYRRPPMDGVSTTVSVSGARYDRLHSSSGY